MRIALVHDWLTGMRGGEKVLSALCELLPAADVLTMIHVPGSCDERIERMPIHTSALSDLPGVGRYYRYLVPLMTLAVEWLDLSGYDLIVSTSHCVAKGVVRPRRAVHVCYCHTPMRYAWSQHDAYRGMRVLPAAALRLMRRYLQAWDRRSAAHVDRFLANSRCVARRIRQTYHRRAEVVHPPVDTEFFTPDGGGREEYYLVVGALAPYKRVDQAVAAFTRLGKPLRVIGTGQQKRIFTRGLPDHITYLGWQSDEAIREHYRRCRALIFPGEEDFGIVPLEATACGAPVIAYGAGGATESVLDIDGDDPCGPTGLLYTPQTVDALAAAVERFEQVGGGFEPARLRRWAQRFSGARFRARLEAILGPWLDGAGARRPC